MKKRDGEFLVFKTSEGVKRINPWDAVFGYFWYNDIEIFHDTERDLELKAEKLATRGVNIVITFSCTHFRWSFQRHHALLNETLAKIVRACHKHDILVVEHHSSELWHAAHNEDHRQWLETVLAKRGSALASWPGLLEDAAGDPVVIDDIRRSRMLQVDGETGSPTIHGGYRSYSMCFNNPDYRRAYFRYLEGVYATGVDGIMTDDVQWLGARACDNACACARCRAKFAASTGMELPPAGEAWTRWREKEGWGKQYLAWRNFRLRAIEEFHRAVMEHYESLGLSLLRPNYCAHALNGNWTGYCLETLPDLDWAFQESCFSSIIRYGWPRWAVEQAHRDAVGRRRGIPVMCTFYPDRPDTALFCWSMAVSWGCKYLATDEGGGENAMEARLRAFERRHARLLKKTKKISSFAVYDARAGREFYRDYDARSGKWTMFVIEACELNNVPYELIQTEDLARLASYRAVFLPEVAALSRNERLAFRSFAENGGILIWGGRSGILDENGYPISPEALAADLGIAGFIVATDDVATSITEYPLGRGRIFTAAWRALNGTPIDDYWVNRFKTDGVDQKTPIKPVDAKRRNAFRAVAEFVRAILPQEARLETDNLPEDVIVSTFGTADKQAMAVHLRNAVGTLEAISTDGGGHDDIIPFPALPDRTAQFFLPIPEAEWRDKIPRAFAYGPENDETLELKCRILTDGRVSVDFPLPALRAYKLIEVAFGLYSTTGIGGR